MKVFLSGATGVIGTRIVEQFKSAGHTVVGLVRDDDGARRVRDLGGTPKHADLFDAGAIVEAAKGCDVFIHAATRLRGLGRAPRRRLGMNDHVRRGGAEAMAEAAVAVGAKHLMFPSIAWVVRPDDGSLFNEEATYNPDASSASAMLTERILRRRADADEGFTLSILRLGVLYAHDAEHTRSLGARLAKGRMGTLGPGRAEWSLLHADDAASAFLAAAKHGKGGLWHVVDERPTPSYDFLAAIAKRIGAPPPKRYNKVVGAVMAGRLALRFFTLPMKTDSQRFRLDTNWKPRFATYEAGLDDVVRHWKAEGFPPEARSVESKGKKASTTSPVGSG